MKNLQHNRTTVTNINYHIVWSTKRRKRVLVPEMARDIQVWCREAALRHGFVIHAMEIGRKDHIHILLSAPTDMPVSKVIQYLKGYTSREAFKRYKFLSKAYPARHMWNPSTFVETIGCISEDTIRKYIKNQNYDTQTERR